MRITAQSHWGLPLYVFLFAKWCPGSDSNRHIFLRQNLNLVRLPISPPGPNYYNNTQHRLCQLTWRKTEESNPIQFLRTWFSRPVAGPTPLHHLPKSWSEYKDSNLGPPGPKPGALPGCATLRNKIRAQDLHILKSGAIPLMFKAGVTTFCTEGQLPKTWYLDTVSNRGPSPCKGDALPLSYPGNNIINQNQILR
jgi:hypothetical protein